MGRQLTGGQLSRRQRFFDAATDVAKWAGVACVAAIVVLCIVIPSEDVPTWLVLSLVSGALVSRPLWWVFVILGS